MLTCRNWITSVRTDVRPAADVVILPGKNAACCTSVDHVTWLEDLFSDVLEVSK